MTRTSSNSSLVSSDYFPNTFDTTFRPRWHLTTTSWTKSDASATTQPHVASDNASPPFFPSLEDWIQVFKASIPSFRRACESDPSVPDAVSATKSFCQSYTAALDQLELETIKIDNPSTFPTVIDLCQMREDCLKAAGFTDPFKCIKHEENHKALALLPEVLKYIDTTTLPASFQRWEQLIKGILAGNIFDLGAAHTSDMFHQNGGVSFHYTRDCLLPRPWVVDDMDALINRLLSNSDSTKSKAPFKKAILFVDNSGSDIILGMLPFARELLRTGCTVVLAANEKPSINDITAAELEELLNDIAQLDDVLCKGISSQRFLVVSSGNALPVIDLRTLSKEMEEHCAEADFVVLEGMGRGIETNLNCKLRCESLKIGMVKHKEVAAVLGGRMLDGVVKYDCGFLKEMGGSGTD